MTFKLLAEQHLEFLRLKGGCTGWSESILFKMPHCWKSHLTAQMFSKSNKKIIKIFWLKKASYLGPTYELFNCGDVNGKM